MNLIEARGSISAAQHPKIANEIPGLLKLIDAAISKEETCSALITETTVLERNFRMPFQRRVVEQINLKLDETEIKQSFIQVPEAKKLIDYYRRIIEQAGELNEMFTAIEQLNASLRKRDPDFLVKITPQTLSVAWKRFGIDDSGAWSKPIYSYRSLVQLYTYRFNALLGSSKSIWDWSGAVDEMFQPKFTGRL